MENKAPNTWQSLTDFRLYLLRTRKISKATTNDYCKRIRKICRDEKIVFSELEKRINELVYDYTQGKKKDVGSMSHDGYSNALKYYLAFVNYSKDIVEEWWDYEIVCGRTKLGLPNVSIYDEKNEETISSVSIGLPNKNNIDESNYQLIATMVQLCLPIIHKEDPNIILDFLEERGFKITFNS